jgi:hypothetical protein
LPPISESAPAKFLIVDFWISSDTVFSYQFLNRQQNYLASDF